MHCPRCGQQQISPEIKFCSRCGFLMVCVTELIRNNGNLPYLNDSQLPKKSSSRIRGLKQGGAWFLLGVFIVPLLGVLSLLIRFPEELIGLAAVVFFLGGFLRMVYALIFETSNPADQTLEEKVFQTAQVLMKKPPTAKELPPQQSIPTSAYVPPHQGNWRDTNDLTPNTVIEGTTKLLDKEQK